MPILLYKSRKYNTLLKIALLTSGKNSNKIIICFFILEEIMKTILISRKSCVIEGFLHEARYVEELEILRTFQDEQEAYDMVGRQEVDLAIIDLDMEKSDGADIGWKLKRKIPIFC
jgi:hypothetical protein